MLRTNKLKLRTTELAEAILQVENNKRQLTNNELEIVMKLKNRSNTNKSKVFINVGEWNLLMEWIK